MLRRDSPAIYEVTQELDLYRDQTKYPLNTFEIGYGAYRSDFIVMESEGRYGTVTTINTPVDISSLLNVKV